MGLLLARRVRGRLDRRFGYSPRRTPFRLARLPHLGPLQKRPDFFKTADPAWLLVFPPVLDALDQGRGILAFSCGMGKKIPI